MPSVTLCLQDGEEVCIKVLKWQGKDRSFSYAIANTIVFLEVDKVGMWNMEKVSNCFKSVGSRVNPTKSSLMVSMFLKGFCALWLIS